MMGVAYGSLFLLEIRYILIGKVIINATTKAKIRLPQKRGDEMCESMAPEIIRIIALSIISITCRDHIGNKSHQERFLILISDLISG